MSNTMRLRVKWRLCRLKTACCAYPLPLLYHLISSSHLLKSSSYLLDPLYLQLCQSLVSSSSPSYTVIPWIPPPLPYLLHTPCTPTLSHPSYRLCRSVYETKLFPIPLWAATISTSWCNLAAIRQNFIKEMFRFKMLLRTTSDSKYHKTKI